MGNKALGDIWLIIFNQIAAHATSEKLNYPIGFLYLICELVLKKCPELKSDFDALSGELKRVNADPKLFTEKYKNDIGGEHIDPYVQEYAPPSFFSVGISSSNYASMRERIIRQLEAEINFKTVEIKMITTFRIHVTLLLRDLKYPVDEDPAEVEEEEHEDLAT